jgi:hypothetical protein
MIIRPFYPRGTLARARLARLPADYGQIIRESAFPTTLHGVDVSSQAYGIVVWGRACAGMDGSVRAVVARDRPREDRQ